MEHRGTVVLETGRLILRRFCRKDAEKMFLNWASDPRVTEYLTWPAHIDVCVTRTLLEDWIPRYEQPDYYNWIICLRDSGEPIGNINAFEERRNWGGLTLGYCMGVPWWGRGYMPEAVRAVMEFLFREAGVNRIQGDYDTRNPKSGRVMEKCGMQHEGILRQAGMTNSGPGDIAVCSILRSEYPI